MDHYLNPPFSCPTIWAKCPSTGLYGRYEKRKLEKIEFGNFTLSFDRKSTSDEWTKLCAAWLSFLIQPIVFFNLRFRSLSSSFSFLKLPSACQLWSNQKVRAKKLFACTKHDYCEVTWKQSFRLFLFLFSRFFELMNVCVSIHYMVMPTASVLLQLTR